MIDIAVEKLSPSFLATKSGWLTDKSKPEWSKKCQARGIINVSASFDGQVPVACIFCSPAYQLSVFHKLSAKQYLSHTFSQKFQIFVVCWVCWALFLRPRRTLSSTLCLQNSHGFIFYSTLLRLSSTSSFSGGSTFPSCWKSWLV
jgi:hypothetical protein